MTKDAAPFYYEIHFPQTTFYFPLSPFIVYNRGQAAGEGKLLRFVVAAVSGGLGRRASSAPAGEVRFA